jgi:hypothetical protein
MVLVAGDFHLGMGLLTNGIEWLHAVPDGASDRSAMQGIVINGVLGVGSSHALPGEARGLCHCDEEATRCALQSRAGAPPRPRMRCKARIATGRPPIPSCPSTMQTSGSGAFSPSDLRRATLCSSSIPKRHESTEKCPRIAAVSLTAPANHLTFSATPHEGHAPFGRKPPSFLRG